MMQKWSVVGLMAAGARDGLRAASVDKRGRPRDRPGAESTRVDVVKSV
jgi:hypothetical protein